MTERRLLLPIRGADPERRPPPGLQLAAIRGGPDDPITPVIERSPQASRLLLFRGVDEIRRWRDPARFIAAPEEALFDLAHRLGTDEIVLDIAGPVRRRLGSSFDKRAVAPTPPFDLRGLAGPLTLEACARIRTEFEREKVIEVAWIVEATVDETAILVVALRIVADTAVDELAERLTGTVLPLLPLESYGGVQIVILDDPAVAEAVEKADAPLYRRD